jgi:hypothetical protein
MTMRLHDWQLQLERFTRERSAIPFAWGTNDCAIFASDAVMAMTGVDPAPADLRLHRTAKEACRAIQSHGGLAAIATGVLGAPVPVAFAGVGDVVLVKAGKRDALAICNGSVALMPSPIGLVAVSLEGAAHAWKV